MARGLRKKRNKPTNKERRQIAEALNVQTLQRQDTILEHVKQMRKAQQGMAEAVSEMAKHNAIMMGVAKLFLDKGLMTDEEFAQILIKAGINYTVREQDESEEQPGDDRNSGSGEGEPELPLGPEQGTDSRIREESEGSDERNDDQVDDGSGELPQASEGRDNVAGDSESA